MNFLTSLHRRFRTNVMVLGDVGNEEDGFTPPRGLRANAEDYKVLERVVRPCMVSVSKEGRITIKKILRRFIRRPQKMIYSFHDHVTPKYIAF